MTYRMFLSNMIQLGLVHKNNLSEIYGLLFVEKFHANQSEWFPETNTGYCPSYIHVQLQKIIGPDLVHLLP